MKNQIINEIQRKMLPYLNNEQLLQLKMVLETSFQGLILDKGEELPKAEEQNAVKAFITAKRIEGCSEKTLTYYSKTIEAMLNGVGKLPQQITTYDLRKYLTDYQTRRRSSQQINDCQIPHRRAVIAHQFQCFIRICFQFFLMAGR